jgi:hypothetical protein
MMGDYIRGWDGLLGTCHSGAMPLCSNDMQHAAAGGVRTRTKSTMTDEPRMWVKQKQHQHHPETQLSLRLRSGRASRHQIFGKPDTHTEEA